MEEQEEINEKLDRYSLHNEFKVEELKNRRDSNRKVKIIRASNLLKDPKIEIARRIEEYGDNSSQSEESENEFQKFEREQILRGTSLVPNSEMQTKEEMQKKVNEAIKTKVKEISLQHVIDVMSSDMNNCKIHITEDNNHIIHLKNGIIEKNDEVLKINKEFNELGNRLMYIEEFGKYVNVLSSCLTKKIDEINTLYNDYLNKITEYSKSKKYRKFFDLYDNIQRFILDGCIDGNGGINSDMLTLLKDVDTFSESIKPKDYYNSLQTREHYRIIHKTSHPDPNDSDSDSEENYLKTNLEKINDQNLLTFSDTLSEYCDINKIIQRFVIFYDNCKDEYNYIIFSYINAYCSLSLADYLIPILKNDIFKYDPSNIINNNNIIHNKLQEINQIIKQNFNDKESNIIITKLYEKLYIPYIEYYILNISTPLDPKQAKTISDNLYIIFTEYHDNSKIINV